MKRPLGLFLIPAFLLPVLLLSLDTETAKFSPAQKRLWSLQPLSKPPVPQVRDATWPAGAIDRFVLAKLESKGIHPNPPADRITLLRRASLDLTGLPPTPEELQTYLSDQAPGAYGRAVERMLASPRYGERWARHWLDLARYADSDGFKSDDTRPNIWRYRDYVIRSFNEDKPYNRFIQEQLAGDELFPGNPDALVATGFTRHFPDEYNARNLVQRRQEWLNDITDNVGSVFLGMTVGCARCHDHKFDPILQKDYYRLQAFFTGAHSEDKISLDMPAGSDPYAKERAAWEEKTAPMRTEMAAMLAKVRATVYEDEFQKYPPEIQAAIKMEPAKRSPLDWQMYYQSRIQLDLGDDQLATRLKGADSKRYRELKNQVADFDSIKPPDRPIAQTMIETGAAPTRTYVLNGGAWDAPREEVQPGFLTILDPSDALISQPSVPGKSGRRSALANWLVNPSNPLTARVIVNRVWHYHFGRGLAATPSDFGMMGDRPANRELLDNLAARFIENGWSLKWLHREIVLSNAYQQSSAYQPEAAKIDSDNKLLWRYERRRLEGEAIRDSMLQVSGALNAKMYGPGVFPPMPSGVVTRGGWKTNEDSAEANRRSIYVFVRRNTRYPMFETFDFPDTHESCARRNATVTPGQALEMLNDDLILGWSRMFAQRVLNDAGIPAEAQIDRAWRLAYSRPPSAEERVAALRFLERQQGLLGQVPEAEVQAFADLCHTLLASNEFLTLN